MSLEPIRAAWRKNGERFVACADLPDDKLIQWAADCIEALRLIDTYETAPADSDEFLQWLNVTSGWPLGSVG